MLVDAPCSGVGAWRRCPDARWLVSERTLCELHALQADVLQRAARLVRPGGTLLYATSSLLRAENEEQIQAFLRSDDGADFERVVEPPAGFSGPPLDEAGSLRLTPARHGCDGVFGARLKRREGGWSRASRRGRGNK